VSIYYPDRSGIFLTIGNVEPLVVENGIMSSMAVRAFTGGRFAFSMTVADNFYPFVYAQPSSASDQRNGGICCETGYWAPGSELVKTARGRAIREYAMPDKRGRAR